MMLAPIRRFRIETRSILILLNVNIIHLKFNVFLFRILLLLNKIKLGSSVLHISIIYTYEILHKKFTNFLWRTMLLFKIVVTLPLKLTCRSSFTIFTLSCIYILVLVRLTCCYNLVNIEMAINEIFLCKQRRLWPRYLGWYCKWYNISYKLSSKTLIFHHQYTKYH